MINADDLLSTHYQELKDYLSNNKSVLRILPLDAPSLFDIPALELLLDNLEGGKVMNERALALALEQIMLNAAKKVAKSINENGLEL